MVFEVYPSFPMINDQDNAEFDQVFGSQKPKAKNLISIGVLFSLVAGIASTIFSTQQAIAKPTTRSISGTVLIRDEHYGVPGRGCNFFRKAYNDIKGGFSIVVKNGKGDILATSSAPAGYLVDAGKETGSGEPLVACQVSIPEFQVPDSDFYAFELAGRKPIVRSRADLASADWKLDLAIGD